MIKTVYYQRNTIIGIREGINYNYNKKGITYIRYNKNGNINHLSRIIDEFNYIIIWYDIYNNIDDCQFFVNEKCLTNIKSISQYKKYIKLQNIL